MGFKTTNLKNLFYLLPVLGMNLISINADAQNEIKKKPNVIVILSDDQGSIDLNCYGAKDLHTPNLDRLAKRGVKFNQFYASASVCSPSRAALLTGKTNLRAGLWGNVPIPEYADKYKKFGLPTEQVTMAEMLKDNGYYTALIGKWHLGHKPETLPNGQGFDHFFGHHGGCIDNYSHYFYWQGPNRHDLYRNDREVYNNGEYFPDLMVNEINTVLDHHGDEPFFIYWAFNAPHYPYQGEEKWLDKYKDLPTPRKEYAAFTSSMDERIGMVMDELERRGIADNTIVIFQSDHGHSREERAFGGGGNAGGLRGSKFTYFEGGLRVPAIISYPAVLPADIERTQPCIETDWFATIAELTGADISGLKIGGKSLMPVIEDEKADPQHDVLYWQHGSYDDNIAQWVVRDGDWKLIGNPKDTDPNVELTDKLFLSNLKMDVTEKENLLEKYPKQAKKLKALHDKWLKDIRKEMKK